MYMIGGLKGVKTYIKLSLCFILVCIIYIGIIPKNEQKTTENMVKEEEKFYPWKL